VEEDNAEEGDVGVVDRVSKGESRDDRRGPWDSRVLADNQGGGEVVVGPASDGAGGMDKEEEEEEDDAIAEVKDSGIVRWLKCYQMVVEVMQMIATLDLSRLAPFPMLLNQTFPSCKIMPMQPSF